jgi:4-amino-4-deoxy-L-arabinose transferase-like glycosyltransferase
VLVVACFTLWITADLVQLSMALDGVIYSAIAQFFAQGQGGFWVLPHFEAGVGGFYDHPPLGLWLLSFWVQCFGSGFWVERSFLLLLIVVFCVGVGVLWSSREAAQPGAHGTTLFKSAPGHHHIWFVMLLLLCMPVVRFTSVNNPLEMLLAVFTLWSVVFAWFGMRRSWWNLIAGLLCSAAILTKGPVGLFPLAAPFLFAWLVQEDGAKAVKNTALAAAPVLLLALGLYVYPPAHLATLAYLETQLIGTFSGLRVPENGRLYLLGQFASNIAIAVVVLLLFSRGRFDVRLPRVSRAYLLIGLCAFIPLLVSPRQYKHYLLSCLPYFAVFLGSLARPTWPAVKVRVLVAAIVVVGLLIAVRAGWHFGHQGKDAVELSDVSALTQIKAEQAQEVAVAFCDIALRRRAYLARYAFVQSYFVPLAELGGLSADAIYVCTDDPGEGFVWLQGMNEGLQVWRRTSAGGEASG